MLNYLSFNETSKIPPIVILHGWGGSIKSLKKLGEKLKNKVSNPIYILDLPGFGLSPLPQKLMTTEDYKNSVKHFMQEKKLQNTILIGHSFGGKISLSFATSKEKNISKMILINSSGIKPKNNLKKKFAQIIKTIIPKTLQKNNLLKKFFYYYVLRERDYLKAGELKQSLSQIVNEHFDNELANTEIPVLIIWGVKDQYVPLWMGEKLQNFIPNSTFITVDEGGHDLPIKHPELVSEIISNWLKNKIK
ncbi:alpha/beta fold hydrolase [Candidatus Dojkabacteria bacterium]|nr:alpha/beta fold hydrolase [Candidatus Dojkabacteria bacterium]